MTIQNVGYCGTEWSIPALPNGYEVVPMSGTIDKDETVIVDVNFEIGKIKKQFSGDFVIETLGKYITVSVSGVGGVPGLKFNPSFLDFGKREKGKRSSQALEIKNISENDLIEFDSLNLLQIVELNDKYFNGLSIKNEKIAKCRSISDLIKLYKGKIK